MDETWIHYFTPESNQLLTEWSATGESRPKRSKTQTSAGKSLASVFGSSINFRKEEPSISIILYSIIGVFGGRNHQKTATV